MEASADPNQESKAASPDAEPQKTSRRHRRSVSEAQEENEATGFEGYPAPFPPQISYAPQSPAKYNYNNNYTDDNGTHPQQDTQYLSQSWSMGGAPPYPYLQQPPMGFPPPQGMHFPPQPPPPPPMVGSSPYGHVMMDPMAMPWDPTMTPPFHQQQQQQQQQQPQQQQPQRGSRGRRGHKRAHSYGSAPQSYGSFGSGAAPPTHRRDNSSSSSQRAGDFSPRNELMKLAGGRRPSWGSASSVRSTDSYPVPPSPIQSSLRGGGSFPQPPPEDFRVSFSGNLGVYGMDGGVPANIPPPFHQNGSGGSGGGEAVFLAQQKKPKGKKQQGQRKMHMRQRSAQLFMEDVKGQEQLPACRDIIFLMLFFFQLLGIVYLGNKYGYQAERYHDDADGDVTIFYSNILYMTCLCGAVAVSVSACALFLFMAIAKKIVQIALVMAITLSFVWGTIGIGFSPSILIPASGFLALLMSVAYAFIVWDRIPFVAANLDTGLHGIRANLRLVVVAFFFQALTLGWSVYFVFVVVGVYDSILVGDIDFEGIDIEKAKIAIYVALGLSYYWTIHVLMNIVQVTVAGLIGKWWFTPDGGTSTRISDLNSSFFRSLFYGIGSICYGSLFVGPVRLIRQLSAFFRPNEEDTSSLLSLHQCLFCIQSCMTSCVDNLGDRYSPWALTYVGLYGYGLVEAGQNASELFEKRGWSTIVSDDLAPNVLLMTSVVIGGVTGLFAHLIENTETVTLTTLGQPAMVSFCLGLAVGLVASSVLFGIITSSVNAVIVCFAASPVDFEQNHPKLSDEMRSAWREVWPGCMDVVDMRVAVATYLDPTMSERNGEHAPLIP